MNRIKEIDYEELKKKLPSYYILDNYDYKVKSLTNSQIVFLIELFNSSNSKLIGNEKKVELSTIIYIINKQLEIKIEENEAKKILIQNGIKEGTKEINFANFIYLVDTLKREKLITQIIFKSISYFFIFILFILLLVYLSIE